MLITTAELLSVLRNFNPWWESARVSEIPKWKRAAFDELYTWVKKPPAQRAVLLSGARQIGKTTLFLQCIESLLNDGVSPEQILYITFDHPILKLVGLEGLVKAWKETAPRKGTEYWFIDEIQNTPDWQTWLKHQADFSKNRRIAATGSAVPLSSEKVESGVGRWHTIKLPTLSFLEYLQIKEIKVNNLPTPKSLVEIFKWSNGDLAKVSASGQQLVPNFNEYLLRGGFPQTCLVDKVEMAQKLLREDIVDKVLKRDMTALYGVRRILELEKIFLYLCRHDGGILDINSLASNLGIQRPTVMNYLEILESAHLIYRLRPFGYGKEVLRAKSKYYLADPSIAGSMFLKGKSLLEDATKMGSVVETAFFKHVFTRFYANSKAFTYWAKGKDQEVDIVAEGSGSCIPFEIKYTQGKVSTRDIPALLAFCEQRKIKRGYVITKDMTELGHFEGVKNTKLLKIPAPLACLWLS